MSGYVKSPITVTRVRDRDGIVIDQYIDWAVVIVRDDLPRDAIDAAIAALDFEPKGAVLKKMAKRPTDSRSEILFGEVPNEPIAVHEGDAVLLCDLHDGVQTGLFVDHQETRFAIRAHAQDVEVLNLFAYTCAFSVHAALGGATRVTSVDVSKRALARGRENMRASGLDPDQHRWFAEDALPHLAKKRRYGLIIIDPPVSGRSGKGHFSLLSELDQLIDEGLGRLEPEGVLVFSTHAQRADLERHKKRAFSVTQNGDLKTLFFRA